MFDHTHYVPVLKGKEGEYLALRELADTVKDGLTPLIEIPSIPYDYANDAPAKTIDEHLAKVTEKIQNCWGVKRPVFVDFDLLLPTEVMSDGRQPLTYVFEGARTVNLHTIPVTGINRTTEYQDAVKTANDTDGFGICIRLESDDLNDPDLNTKVNDLLTMFGELPQNIDMVVDFGAIVAGVSAAILAAANSLIASIPLVRDWRTFTFAASGFPPDLSDLTPRTISLIPRTEWTLWQNLVSRRLLRFPTFGDYAIAHPVVTEVDPRIMKMSAQLRYTSDEHWLVFKARNVKDYGFGQFNDICRALIGRPEYKGAAFSWGDNQIGVCAAPGGPPGNATTWRRIGTNHHLTFVVDQIANLP